MLGILNKGYGIEYRGLGEGCRVQGLGIKASGFKGP